MIPNQSPLVKLWRRLVRGQHALRPYYYLGPDTAMTRLTDGHWIYVDPRDHSISAQLITRGSWERETHAVIRALVSPGDRVVDVGTNLGYYALAMAKGVGPSGHVTAIEANPHLARLVRLTLQFNKYSNYTRVLQRAASDSLGTVRFTTSSQNSGGGHLHFENSTLGDDTRVVEVETVRLDDLDLGDIKLIRIDTEGSEALVLRGAAGLLQRPDVIVCMEWDMIQMRSRSSPAELVAWLAGQGFRFWRITTGQDPAGPLVEVAASQMVETAFCDMIASRQPVVLTF